MVIFNVIYFFINFLESGIVGNVNIKRIKD